MLCCLQENPFVNTTWDTCSVVGNGGILANSSCGEKIDSAQFVIRCETEKLLHHNYPFLSNIVRNKFTDHFPLCLPFSGVISLLWRTAMRETWATRQTWWQLIPASSWRSEFRSSLGFSYCLSPGVLWWIKKLLDHIFWCWSNSSPPAVLHRSLFLSITILSQIWGTAGASSALRGEPA